MYFIRFSWSSLSCFVMRFEEIDKDDSLRLFGDEVEILRLKDCSKESFSEVGRSESRLFVVMLILISLLMLLLILLLLLLLMLMLLLMLLLLLLIILILLVFFILLLLLLSLSFCIF